MSEGTPVLRMPIRGTFFGCCPSAGVESANTISTTRNRSGIGPSDWKVRGFKHCYSETPALSLAPKSYCGEAPVCLVSALASSHSEQRCDCQPREHVGRLA